MAEDKIQKVEDEVNLLQDALTRMGKNTKGDTDVFGRRFVVPVNAEHKATCARSRKAPMENLRAPLCTRPRGML